MKQYGKDLICELCKTEIDDQKHLFKCPVIESMVPELKNTDIKYENIFGNIDEMILVAKLLKKICSAREDTLILLSSQS